ncbi:MAG: DUF3152 domain-containing protein [Actinobacteria bacterium]|nr:DUF3152 domain-containing protein [Actinomycetota bacterium]
MARSAVLATTAMVLIAGVMAVPAAAHPRYSFSVTTRGEVAADVERVAAVARATLNDPRGWSLGGSIAFDQVPAGGHFQVVLASPSVIEAAAPICSARYSCRVGDQVLVNDVRWRSGTPSWTRSLEEYQRYVIIHEVGHWLGLRHADCPGPGSIAPVMHQQSISLDGCVANVWPLDRERNAVADLHGVVDQYDTQAGVLQTGARGTAVIDWQSMLRAWNPVALLVHGVDGVLGPETEKWTRKFQRSRGIKIDGLIGPETRRAMKSAP